MNHVLRHRLRNIASGVKTSVLFMSREFGSRLKPEEQEYFPLIVTECDNLASIANRISQLFDELPANTSTTTFGKICERLDEILRKRFPTTPIKYDLSSALRDYLCDKTEWYVALFEELINNAAEAGPDRDILFAGQIKDACLVFRISDQGNQPNDEEFANMFLPFYTTKPQHLGIGLVIVKKILAAINGTVQITRTNQPGCLVEVTVPRV